MGKPKKRVIATTNKLYKQKFGIDALVCGQYDLFFALFEEPQKKLEHCERPRFILGILQKLEINSELDFAEVSLKWWRQTKWAGNAK